MRVGHRACMGALAATSITIPHLAVPVHCDAGTFAVVEQDTSSEILQCIVAITSTLQGSVLDDPDYGLPDGLFQQQPVSLAKVTAALTRQEPRATYVLDTHPDATAVVQAVIDVRAGLVAA